MTNNSKHQPTPVDDDDDDDNEKKNGDGDNDEQEDGDDDEQDCVHWAPILAFTMATRAEQLYWLLP